MKKEKELKVAIEAARKASEIIKKFASERDFKIQMKGKNDLVTQADFKSEEIIISTIKNYFSDDRIIAEESESKQTNTEDRVWIIDPIDGTTNFAHGFPVYCVSIAFMEHKEIMAGVVLEVNSDECFTASKEQGAWLNDNEIRIDAEKEPSDSLIGTGFPYNDLNLTRPYLQLLEKLMSETRGIRRPGAAAYDLCNVACGRFQGFYEYGLNPWDVAAGALIIKEAGGTVTDWIGGDNWMFGKRIIAGTPKVHPFLHKIINEFFSKEDLVHNAT